MRLGACAPVVVSPICDVHVAHAASYRAALGPTRVHLVLHRQRVDGHTDTPRVLSLMDTCASLRGTLAQQRGWAAAY